MDEIGLIKKIAITAMVSNDYLFDRLVLKGGNAMDIIYKLSGRASMDLDFSIEDDFPDSEFGKIEEIINSIIEKSFFEKNYKAFDISFSKRPDNREISEDLKEFWGGYRIEFKVISLEKYNKFDGKIEDLRKNALEYNAKHSRKFFIDISQYEYIKNKETKELDGYAIYVYSPEMLAFEKIRAICQQMPEYGKVVRSNSQSARARDFYDIHLLSTVFHIDYFNEENQEILNAIFDAKRVPLYLIGRISETKEFHRPDFYSVKDTVPNKLDLKDFDFYFDYVCGICEKLKPLWIK